MMFASDVKEKRLKRQAGFTMLSLRHVASLVIVITLVMLGAVIFLAHLQLRNGLREQISRRDAKAVDTLWMAEQLSDWESELGPLTDAADYLFPLLETNKLHKFAQIPSVRATRLFDSEGRVVILIPEILPDAQISAADFAILATLNPVTHFIPAARPADLSILPAARNS